ncbi:hypothetical protein [Sphingomonas koreensis]|uniref:hypothetical protein n=1 Tax=Sphingomonas koreensis TaxID=93064 RepID=UPI000F7F3A97|nr:hypothetical protein [Sphingomonas koreensis]
MLFAILVALIEEDLARRDGRPARQPRRRPAAWQRIAKAEIDEGLAEIVAIAEMLRPRGVWRAVGSSRAA